MIPCRTEYCKDTPLQTLTIAMVSNDFPNWENQRISSVSLARFDSLRPHLLVTSPRLPNPSARPEGAEIFHLFAQKASQFAEDEII